MEKTNNQDAVQLTAWNILDLPKPEAAKVLTILLTDFAHLREKEEEHIKELRKNRKRLQDMAKTYTEACEGLEELSNHIDGLYLHSPSVAKPYLAEASEKLYYLIDWAARSYEDYYESYFGKSRASVFPHF